MWPADMGVVVWSLCCAVLWERSRHGVTSDKRKLSVCRRESAAGLRPLFLGFNVQDLKEFKADRKSVV